VTIRDAFWWFRTIAILLAFATLAWTGILPSPDDPKAWYVRAIRGVGAIIFLAALAFGAYLQWQSR
jgi:hypothetical protein